jgi:hypothetical protein
MATWRIAKLSAAVASKLATGTFGERYLVISAISLFVDFIYHLREVWRDPTLGNIGGVVLRSLLDSVVFTALWSLLHRLMHPGGDGRPQRRKYEANQNP